MLSGRSLERATSSYRRGYRAGYAHDPQSTPDNGIAQIHSDIIGGTIKPFADFDYNEGYRAGANDRKWDDYYASKH